MVSSRSPAPRPPSRCPTRTGSTARSGCAPPAPTMAGPADLRGRRRARTRRAGHGPRPARRRPSSGAGRAGAARARDHGGDRPVRRGSLVPAGAVDLHPARGAGPRLGSEGPHPSIGLTARRPDGRHRGGRKQRSQGADRPVLGVGMVGYAFMGAAHSQAWRTAPHVFDLPLQPAHGGAVRPGRGRGARRGARGSAGRPPRRTGTP